MERFIAELVKDYESGKVDRREFCKTVALAATVYAAGDAASAGPSRPQADRHQSHLLHLPRLRQGRDWYASVLGMEKAPGKDNGQRANLMFGPEPGKGGSFVVARTARPPANPRPPAQSFVDHVCYTIPSWDDGRVNAALKATGRPFTSRSGNVNVLDPFNYPVQLANSEEEIRGNKRGRFVMEGFVATKLDEFDRGKISRRHLIETLTLAATSAYASEAPRPKAPP